jgi:hypothetical protein
MHELSWHFRVSPQATRAHKRIFHHAKTAPRCSIAYGLLLCASMDSEIVGEITYIDTVAGGGGVRERARLHKFKLPFLDDG